MARKKISILMPNMRFAKFPVFFSVAVKHKDSSLARTDMKLRII